MPKDEAGNDFMSEERRKLKEADEWAAPKRECPVPKPGGLIGQVLGLKDEEAEEEEPPSIATQIQIARRKPTPSEEES